jgi:Flp pilus assembly protein CpaB
LRRRPTPYWLATGLLAIATGVAVSALVERADAAFARYGTSRRVAVASHDLAEGETIGPGDVELRQVPSGLVPDGAVEQIPTGQTVRAPVYEGEVVVAARLAPAGLTGTAALLPPGTRAIAVPVDVASSLELDIGDAVDVLVALDPSVASDEPAVTVARGAPVVALGEAAVTIAVTADEAPRLAFALSQGTVTLALVA